MSRFARKLTVVRMLFLALIDCRYLLYDWMKSSIAVIGFNIFPWVTSCCLHKLFDGEIVFRRSYCIFTLMCNRELFLMF